MSNVINIQNQIRSASQELVKAREAGDWELVEKLEDEIGDLNDELDALYDDESNGRNNWDGF